MFARSRSAWAAAVLWSLSPIAYAFSFTSEPLSQCDDMSISWAGGTPPYQLHMIPIFGIPRNMPIPSDAFKDGQGSFSAQVPFQEGQQVILTMSDNTGFGSGGSTNVLAVGPSRGGSCNTAGPASDFVFELNTVLQQCKSYVISGYQGAIQPVKIMGVIPSGTPFVLNPPTGPSDFEWKANVANGTSIVFFMVDSKGRDGGSSQIQTVGVSNDNTCLNNLSPSSTTAIPTSSSTAVPSVSGTSTSSPSASAVPANHTSIAAIAGTVIGALLFLAVSITLGLFCLRKQRDSPGNFYGRSRRLQSEVDLTYDAGHVPGNYTYPSPSNPTIGPPPSSPLPYDANPFLDSQPQLYQQPSQYPYPSRYQASLRSDDPFDPYAAHDQSPSTVEPFSLYSANLSASRDSMSTTPRRGTKAGLPATYKPPRLIVHTDVEDELPAPNEHGVVELPPQYSERRGLVEARPPSRNPTESTQGPVLATS